VSDNWTILIPEQPDHVPSVENQKRAEALLGELCPDADEICVEVTEQIRFEDCGQNFGKIACPNCGQGIKMDWWSDRMSDDLSEDRSFKLQLFKVPCCGTERRLHDLNYEWPMGFAKFAVKARNANIGKVSADYLTALESAVGCPLRVIYCRI
jgi:hypothetical protein